MSTCKNCKHWQSDQECAALDNDIKPPTNGLSVEVNVLDDSGLYVTIKTGPDFGCTLFEPSK